MKTIQETWQAAVKERGDNAFELFELAVNGKNEFHGTFDNEYFNELFSRNNPESFIHKQLWKGTEVRLKPISELIKLDIKRYEKWAFLMYEIWSMCNEYFEPFKSNIDLQESLTHPLIDPSRIYRKLYANIPFNIEWAKAGLATEIYVNNWKKCQSKTFENRKFPLIQLDNISVSEFNLSHPFPPIKEL